jgi:hypothetical protein
MSNIQAFPNSLKTSRHWRRLNEAAVSCLNASTVSHLQAIKEKFGLRADENPLKTDTQKTQSERSYPSFAQKLLAVIGWDGHLARHSLTGETPVPLSFGSAALPAFSVHVGQKFQQSLFKKPCLRLHDEYFTFSIAWTAAALPRG